MTKQTKKYAIFHWDTFDNITILISQSDSRAKIDKVFDKKYKDRVSSQGADRVDIVQKGKGIVASYAIK